MRNQHEIKWGEIGGMLLVLTLMCILVYIMGLIGGFIVSIAGWLGLTIIGVIIGFIAYSVLKGG